MWGPPSPLAPVGGGILALCCPWRIWELPESGLGILSLHRHRGTLPQFTLSSWGGANLRGGWKNWGLKPQPEWKWG